MRRVGAGFTAIMFATLALGCAATPQPAGVWIANHGGLLPAPDMRQARVNLVSQKLIAACRGRKITIQVLATDTVTAFSLWDGHVFVARGLVDHLDDAELQ